MILTKSGGILGPIASVLGVIMDFLFKITGQFGIFNVGLCIILFTIVTKMLMLLRCGFIIRIWTELKSLMI